MNVCTISYVIIGNVQIIRCVYYHVTVLIFKSLGTNLFVVPCRERDVRLRGSSSERIGRFEVCVNSSWGTICSRSWNSMDASVACRQLGFSPYGLFVGITVSYDYIISYVMCRFFFIDI